MQCPRCERANREDARFCDGCGQALPRACAGCGRALRDEARFCDGCGRPVDAAAPAPEAEPEAPPPRDPRAYTPAHLADRILDQRAAVEGERKHVTVLFADLVDSTPLVERMDPEEVHALMDRAFARILEQVHRYEGTVNQFLGDGVMALFGAPLALEDAPRRAVLAALGIQRALEALDAEVQAEYGVPFHMRIGIHSGFVVVGRIGDDLRMDYTAVGDTTHLADRIQGRAGPGQVLVSEATANLVEGYFELRDRGAAPAKGFPEPVRCFEVGAELAARDRIDVGAALGLTPFVGRDTELGSLEGAFANAADGRGQVVVVAGDAGIGKSRLLYEFRARLDGRPHVWLEGRCSAYGQSTAFLCIADLLRRHFGIEDRDDESAAVARLEQSVASLGGDLAWTLPFLRLLLSLPSGDEAVDAMEGVLRRSESVRAVQAMLLRLAEKSPLVFAVEDLHWIDPASEELITWLAGVVPTSPVLMVLTCRPGYQPPFRDRSYAVRLGVQPLSPGSVSAMAKTLVESEALPPELLQLVAQKAEGNPLFVEEILKSLLEDGAIAIEDGRARLRSEPAAISVPDSIHDVLMARLDRLDDGPKRAIQVASVIGREFALRLLAAIREAGDRVQDVVGELRALELIYEKAAHPELAFMFKHALTHDVAYDSILQARRRELHRIVGLAIEELYADRLAEHYEALAHHFERADDVPRAFRYHVAAARRAAAQFANHSAIEHFETSLALLDRFEEGVEPGEQRSDLEAELGTCHATMSDFAHAVDAYLRAAEAATSPAWRARALALASQAGVWAHDYDRLDGICEEAIELSRSIGDQGSEAIARGASQLLAFSARGPEAVPDGFRGVVSLARASGDSEARSLGQALQSLYLEMRGDFREAIVVAEQATRDASETRGGGRAFSLGPGRSWPGWVLGLALTASGEYGRALKLFRAGLSLCERVGDRAIRARLLNTLGWLHAEIGAQDLARGFNEQSIEMANYLIDVDQVVGAPEVRANAMVNLAGNWTATGETGRALDLVEPLAASIGRPGEDPWNQWRYAMHVQHALARITLSRGEPERALQHLAAELAAARSRGARKLIARSLELRGRALLAMDRRDEAREAMAEAGETAEAIGYVPVLWRVDALAIELARRGGDASEAERRSAAVRARIDAAARQLPDEALRQRCLDLGARLVQDPLGAHR